MLCFLLVYRHSVDKRKISDFGPPRVIFYAYTVGKRAILATAGDFWRFERDFAGLIAQFWGSDFAGLIAQFKFG